MFSKKISSLVLLLVLISSTESQVIKDDEILNREREMLSKHSNRLEVLYSKYLADASAYTTKGFDYVKKHRRLLLVLCADLIETHKFNLSESYIGFYTDGKALRKERYYLGIEFNFGDTNRRSYEEAAAHFATSHLKQITTSLSSCYKIFEDPNVVGSVIRLTWKRQGKTEYADFWLTTRDIFLYQTNKQVLVELIVRSAVTNMDGVIIRLPL